MLSMGAVFVEQDLVVKQQHVTEFGIVLRRLPFHVIVRGTPTQYMSKWHKSNGYNSPPFVKTDFKTAKLMSSMPASSRFFPSSHRNRDDELTSPPVPVYWFENKWQRRLASKKAEKWIKGLRVVSVLAALVTAGLWLAAMVFPVLWLGATGAAFQAFTQFFLLGFSAMWALDTNRHAAREKAALNEARYLDWPVRQAQRHAGRENENKKDNEKEREPKPLPPDWYTSDRERWVGGKKGGYVSLGLGIGYNVLGPPTLGLSIATGIFPSLLTGAVGLALHILGPICFVLLIGAALFDDYRGKVRVKAAMNELGTKKSLGYVYVKNPSIDKTQANHQSNHRSKELAHELSFVARPFEHFAPLALMRTPARPDVPAYSAPRYLTLDRAGSPTPASTVPPSLAGSRSPTPPVASRDSIAGTPVRSTTPAPAELSSF